MVLRGPAHHARDEDAENAEGVVVAPSLTRCEGERKARGPRQPLVCAEPARLRTGLQSCLEHGLGERGVGRHHAVAAGVCEQVAHGDRPGRRPRVIERRVRMRQHDRVGELRQPSCHGVIELDEPTIDQPQRRDGGDGFGHGLDAEDRVDGEVGSAERGRAHGERCGVGIRRDNDGDGSGNGAGRDVTRQQLLERGGHEITVSRRRHLCTNSASCAPTQAERAKMAPRRLSGPVSA